jgi:lysine-N-methylase
MLDNVRPHYAGKFRCIGNECEDHCCHGWSVFVDEATYQKYRAHPKLSSFAEQHLEVVPHSCGGRYAAIRYGSSSNCPMLTADRMCSIQKEYGEHYLSVTCATYPRVTSRLDGLLETALALSCPEAARLVLLDPQLVPPETGESRYGHLLSLQDHGSGRESALRSFWEIREFSLLLVRDRSYPLWQRVFLLGMFCRRLDEIAFGRQLWSVPMLVRQYAGIVTGGELHAAMEGIPTRVDIQVRMVMEVAQSYLCHQDQTRSRMRECLEDFQRGTGYDDASPCLENCTRAYAEAYDRYYAPFMERHPFLLENYLVNHIFQTQFPFGQKSVSDHEGPLRNYLLMSVELAAIMGLLIGTAGHYRETFGIEQVVKVVQAFTKSVEHSPVFRKALNWGGLADTNSIAALLKN